MSSVRAGAGRSTRSVTGAEVDHDQSRLHWGGAVGKNLVRNFHALEALDGICEVDPVRLEEFTQQYPEARTFSTPDEVFAAEDVSAVAIANPCGDARRLGSPGPGSRQGRLRREAPVPRSVRGALFGRVG